MYRFEIRENTFNCSGFNDTSLLDCRELYIIPTSCLQELVHYCYEFYLHFIMYIVSFYCIAQTGSYRHVRKYYLAVNSLHFVGFQATEISQEMKMLIVLQNMLYQKHNLHILTTIQMFLLRSRLLSHLCGRNGGIKRLVTNCTPSCPKSMISIIRDVQIEKMRLLSIAFE